MKQLKAVLCGYYGKGNGGDEALLASLLQMLPSHVSPIVMSGNPTETQARYGVACCDRNSFWQVFQALQQSQIFIWGGGSLIQDVTSALSPLYYEGWMFLAQRMGLTTLAWAQGIGPLHRSLNRWIARQIFAGCAGVTVRDQGSADLLRGWGISHQLAPDPVWALESTAASSWLDIPAPRVAIALRPHPDLTSTRLQRLTAALAHFQQVTQVSLLLLPFQPIQDLGIAQAIQPQLPGPSQILCVDDPKVLKGVFQAVEMTIAMRFHGLIMAISEGCRCFAISYDPKVSQLMAALNLPGLEVAQLPENPIDLSQLWLHQYQRECEVSTFQRQSLINQALSHREVFNTLDKGLFRSH
jgi:polysaccharide pyruvyl transferase CsaB